MTATGSGPVEAPEGGVVSEVGRTGEGREPNNDTTPTTDGDWLASRFHAVYEQMAPAFGYETRDESAVSWEQVPHRNKALMRAVAVVVEDDLRQRIAGEVEAAGRADVGWLREHAQDITDRTRTIGAQDAWHAALRIIRGGAA